MEDYQEEQSEIQQPEEFGSYPPYYQHPIGTADPNLIRFLLNSQDVVKYIEKTLMGFKLNDKGKWERDKYLKPLKRKAINILIRILRSQLPKNQTLANLEYNDVIRMARSIRFNIIDAIHENWELFTYAGEKIEEPNLSLCDEIVCLIDHNCFANLTRAKDGRESRLIRTVYKQHDMAQVAQRSIETQSGGMFSGLFRRKRFFVPTGLTEEKQRRLLNG
jgi:hypothetical protein